MVDDDKLALLQAFDEIQGPRTRYQLEKVVVGAKFTEPHQYHQCVLELQIAYDNLRIAEQKFRQKEAEIAEKKVEQEQLQRAMLGSRREFEHLYAIWKRFPRRYTREEIEAAAPEEYETMFKTHSLQDLQERGSISVGNQDALRMARLTAVVGDAGQVRFEKEQENEQLPAAELPQLKGTEP